MTEMLHASGVNDCDLRKEEFADYKLHQDPGAKRSGNRHWSFRFSLMTNGTMENL
jgi:hypothetical protein